MTNLVLREPTAKDSSAIGQILFTAFKTIADQHGFPPDLPSAEMATGLLGGLVEHPGFYGIVAELDGLSMATENRTFVATENCTLLGRTSRPERTFSR